MVMGMQSRMERYHSNENSTKSRSRMNQDLYDKLYESKEYNNIEELSKTPSGNVVDINKIKEMINTQKTPIVKPNQTTEIKIKKVAEDKNYDIRDILSKAKEDQEDSKYHSLSNTQYDILKSINLKDHEQSKEEAPELKDLINTITNVSLLNKMGDKELSLDMLSELQTTDSTVIDDESIKAIIEDAKRNEKKEETTELDKSFFTKSLGLTSEDFEELKDINANLKKNNTLVKVLTTITVIAITSALIFLVYMLLK